MSLDYVVYVKTRRRSMKSVRAVATQVLGQLPGASLAAPSDESEEDELHIVAPRASGVVSVTIHQFGVGLAISSTTGVRETFVALGDLVDDIAGALGTVLSEEDAANLLEKEEEAYAVSRRSPLANMVLLTLLGREGEVLAEERETHANFIAQHLPGGMLRPTLLHDRVSPLLSDAGRYPLRGALLRCVHHDEDGRPFRQSEFELDGYGRVTSFTVTDV